MIQKHVTPRRLIRLPLPHPPPVLHVLVVHDVGPVDDDVVAGVGAGVLVGPAEGVHGLMGHDAKALRKQKRL